MKILTFKRVLGLAAIGGFAYIHKDRGGVWTVASIKDTLHHVWSSVASKLGLVQGENRQAPSRGTNLTEAAAHERPPGEHGSRSYNDNSRRKDITGRP